MSRRKYAVPGAPIVVCRRWRLQGHRDGRLMPVHRGLDRSVWRAIWNDKRRAEKGRWHG